MEPASRALAVIAPHAVGDTRPRLWAATLAPIISRVQTRKLRPTPADQKSPCVTVPTERATRSLTTARGSLSTASGAGAHAMAAMFMPRAEHARAAPESALAPTVASRARAVANRG